MGPMTFCVHRREGLLGLIDGPADGDLVALGEELGADDLAVACEVTVARSGPTGRRRRKAGVVKAEPGVGVDTGVEYADDDVGGVVGVGPDAGVGGEAEEGGGVGGVRESSLVGDDGEN